MNCIVCDKRIEKHSINQLMECVGKHHRVEATDKRSSALIYGVAVGEVLSYGQPREDKRFWSIIYKDGHRVELHESEVAKDVYRYLLQVASKGKRKEPKPEPKPEPAPEPAEDVNVETPPID